MPESAALLIVQVFIAVGAFGPLAWIAFGPRLKPLVTAQQQEHVSERNTRRAWQILPARVKRSGVMANPSEGEVRHGPPTS